MFANHGTKTSTTTWLREPLHSTPIDLEPETRPDYVHDITQATTHLGKFDVVFATHLLEHVPLDKFDEVIQNIEQLVAPEGHLWVSVPNIYPYHERPIDNGWRPTADEIVKPFSGKLIKAYNFSVEHTLEQYKHKPKNRISCALFKY